MDRKALENKIAENCDSDECEIAYESHEIEDATLQTLRDRLLDVGKILEEDLEKGFYVAAIGVGPAEVTSATLVAGIDNGMVHAVACSDGPGGTRRAAEAMQVFFDAMRGNVRKPRKRHGIHKVVAFAILLIAFIAAAYWVLIGSQITSAIEATRAYNEAVESFNAVVPSYNETAAGLAIENVRGIVGETKPLSIQPTDVLSVAGQIMSGNDTDKMRADAQTVKRMKIALEADEAILNSIDNPEQLWVIAKLGTVEDVEAIEAVTAENDPNGLLGNPGGYTSCIYFTTTMMDSTGVAGDGPVAKGVDGGGAIEVYATSDAARARCDYLDEFEGTILYSGSYALIGTMVVRTSCLLADDAQYVLTDEIITAMTTQANNLFL